MNTISSAHPPEARQMLAPATGATPQKNQQEAGAGSREHDREPAVDHGVPETAVAASTSFDPRLKSVVITTVRLSAGEVLNRLPSQELHDLAYRTAHFRAVLADTRV